MTVQQYIDNLPEDRKAPMAKLRQVILDNLPEGFEETMGYGMPYYVVPLSLYPAGYHCDPKAPLGLISIASQKNYIVLHHLGLYGDPKLLEWFQSEYPRFSKTKLDMGKGCVRFKKPDQIPFELIAELAKKLTPEDWIAHYEKALKR